MTPQEFLNEALAQAPLIAVVGHILARKIDALGVAQAKAHKRLDRRVDAIEKRLGIVPEQEEGDDE